MQESSDSDYCCPTSSTSTTTNGAPDPIKSRNIESIATGSHNGSSFFNNIGRRRRNNMENPYSDGEILSDEDSFGPTPPPPDYPPPPDDVEERVAAAMLPPHVDTYGENNYPPAPDGSYDGTYPDGDKFRDEYSDEGPIYEGGMMTGGSSANSRDMESKGEDPPQDIAHSDGEYEEDDVDYDIEEDQSVEIPPTTVVQRMVMKENEDKTDRNRNTVLLAVLCCCFVVGAIILIVGFSTDMFKKDNGSSTSAAAGSTQGRGVDAPSPAPNSEVVDDGRAERVFTFLRDVATDPSTLDDPSSPQSKAFSYLSAEDTSNFDPDKSEADKFRLTQKFALLAGYFYPSTLPWSDQQGWASSEDECSWAGVGCSEITLEDGTTVVNAVTDINLFENNVQGLSDEIGLLPYTTYIDLHSNVITGPVPASIVRLTALEELYLYENAMDGEWPADLSPLQNLSILFISDNGFEGDINKFWVLTSLTRLILDDNQFSGTLVGVSALQSLERFTVGNNEITGEVVAELAQCPSLSVVWLFSNQLTGTIPDEIGNMSSLTVFDVYDNGLGNGSGLPLVFLNNPNLQVLSLSDNPWGGVIPDGYGNFPSLMALSIENSGLTGSINENLGNLDSVVVLRLARNNFDSAQFPEFILDMTQLLDLRLNRCRILGGMPVNLRQLTNLQTLYLQDNFMSGALRGNLANLPLQRLDLSNQFFSNAIPDNWSNFAEMIELSLANNALTGPLPVIANMPALERLEVQGNELTGTLTTGYLTDAPALKYVDLSETSISGSLANDWGAMTELEELRLNDIGLTGDIPDSLGDVSTLKVLDLSDNNFENSIPDMFSGLTELRVVELSRNKLVGPIPTSIGSCTKLQSLRVGNNYVASEDAFGITGPLPAALGNLVNLKVFECNDNKINGVLPAEMGNMVSLEILDISSNLFSGDVPTELESLENLELFFLSSNNFNSNWPNTICAIESLDKVVPDCNLQCPTSCCTSCV